MKYALYFAQKRIVTIELDKAEASQDTISVINRLQFRLASLLLKEVIEPNKDDIPSMLFELGKLNGVTDKYYVLNEELANTLVAMEALSDHEKYTAVVQSFLVKHGEERVDAEVTKWLEANYVGRGELIFVTWDQSREEDNENFDAYLAASPMDSAFTWIGCNSTKERSVYQAKRLVKLDDVISRANACNAKVEKF